jgi:hypothetical protein
MGGRVLPHDGARDWGRPSLPSLDGRMVGAAEPARAGKPLGQPPDDLDTYLPSGVSPDLVGSLFVKARALVALEPWVRVSDSDAMLIDVPDRAIAAPSCRSSARSENRPAFCYSNRTPHSAPSTARQSAGAGVRPPLAHRGRAHVQGQSRQGSPRGPPRAFAADPRGRWIRRGTEVVSGGAAWSRRPSSSSSTPTYFPVHIARYLAARGRGGLLSGALVFAYPRRGDPQPRFEGDLVNPPMTFVELLRRLARVVPDVVAAVREHTSSST